jgi:glycosyltransferase involved in cell wall biosynthesis
MTFDKPQSGEGRPSAPTGQPLVSVLTPVYNTEKYLSECIQSVLRQTYGNWEYVIVDNQSNDRSLEVAESFAKLDPRIRVVRNERHLPMMENANCAFHHMSAESRYCKVIHADDWMFPECLARMVEVAEENPSVGIVGSYRLVETEVQCDVLSYPSPCSKGREIARGHLLGRFYIFGSPSTLLLRSDLIRQRGDVYDTSSIHGDVLACLDLLRESDFGFVHQVLTFTRRRNESAFGMVRRYGTAYSLQMMQCLVAYGRDFLSDVEYDRRVKEHLWDYHKFVARKLMRGKGLDFYRFHSRELEKLGIALSYWRLILGGIWELLNIQDNIKRVSDGSSGIGVIRRP